MTEREPSGGNSKSRSVLGDLTDRTGTRRIPRNEKRVDRNDKDGVKRIRLSPGIRTEMESFKGDVVPATSDENRNPNLQCLVNSNAASRRSVHLDLNSDGSNDLNGENVVTRRSSKVHGDNDGPMTSGIDGGPSKIIVLDRSSTYRERLQRRKYQSNNERKSNQPYATLMSQESGGTSTGGKAGNVAIIGRDERSESQTVGLSAVRDCGKTDLLKNVFSSMKDKTDSKDATVAEGCSELHSSKGNMLQGTSELVLGNNRPKMGFNVRETNGGNNLNFVDLGRGNPPQCMDVRANAEQHDRFAAGSSTSAKNRITGKEIRSLEARQSEVNFDLNADNLIMSQSSSCDPETIGAVGLDRSSEKGDCVHISGGTESIRGCSCSFCAKAAHIWLDLHQEDIEGRVSVVRKSQRDAALLAEKSCGSSSNASDERMTGGIEKMQSHLMNQWRCLFQGMAGIWKEEGNHLEASLQPLVELREKCRTNMKSSKLSSKEVEHQASKKDISK
ncbi:uncharacterized protein LOC127258513 [Andrographis paniculata]|uniref:uncharacterized protein LOC127258513 n=1 Tax=Andrographis paniculata TaxID=175694 RepID=UPI0021E7D478|nr:uncharacterized protein LOC127258513 [Andrographis paniculata]